MKDHSKTGCTFSKEPGLPNIQLKMKLTQKFVCCLIFFSTYVSAETILAQTEYNKEVERLTPPSPQAAIMQRFGEYPVDYCTGVPSINIPLYEIKIGHYTLPISISYHASGIKVQDVAGPVGLGWSLMAGGMINREVKHGADQGILDYKSESQIDELITQPNRDYGAPWCILAGDKGFDTETDRYTYSFNGKSGVFRHSADDYTIVKIPYTPILIDEIPSGFRITDTDGVQYYFTATESSWPDGGNHSVSTWLITKIILAERTDSIVFSYIEGPQYVMQSRNEYKHKGSMFYNTVGDDPKNPGLHTIHEVMNHTDDCSSTVYYHVQTKLLSCISWNGNSISFSHASRNDYQRNGNHLSRLSTMTVRNSDNQQIREIEFGNDAYFGDDAATYRLQLQQVSIKGNANDETCESYLFDYNSKALPEYYQHISHTMCHEDYYGYYNGKNNEGWIPQEYKLNDGDAEADRSIDRTGAYSKACILEKITYPTGGWTEFSFEPNKTSDSSYVGGLRVRTIKSMDANGTLRLKTYKYEMPDVPVAIERELYAYPAVYEYLLILGSSLPYVCSDEHIIDKSSPAIPLTGDYGCPVYYMRVTEFNGSESNYSDKTVLQYCNGRPSDISWYQDNNHDTELPAYYSTTYNYDMGMIKPNVYKKTVYNQNDNIEFEEETTYEEVLIDTVRLGVRFCNLRNIATDEYYYVKGRYFKQYYTYSNVYAIPSFLRKSGTSVLKDGITVETRFNYDADLRTDAPISESTSVIGSNEVYKTSYQFPFDFPDSAVYNTMVQRNQLVPICISKEKGNVRISQTETHYRMYGNMCLPDYVSTAIGDEPLKKRLSYDHTACGRVCLIQKDASDYVYFAWGNELEFPYAKIEGLSDTQLKDIFGYDFYYLNPQILTHEYETLRNAGALITLYNYTPLVGLSSMLLPNGTVQTFEYDAMGRLKSSYVNGSLTDEYDFHYKE